MLKYTLSIEGMQCPMCEAHINDTIRKAVPGATKVSASAGKKSASFVTESAVDQDALKKAIDETGYTMRAIESAPYEKKGFFSFLHK
ncbi:MAG: cation transporter [Eubacteriales bacterium]|nr:cation transporter [Eubacteriales bacterium]